MAKEISGYVKLQVKGGQANPAPPIGPALGSKGVNIMEFCKQFNARTQDKMGKVLPVLLTVYTDKSFEFIIKTPAGGSCSCWKPPNCRVVQRSRIVTKLERLPGRR
ncbi:hypothetical protein ACQ86N_07000 [Puia sp. P3]|uniref:hypothetical protein n=1 Tax=Puia sp. P3 TaxID=3423952 RepID=UPI003D66E6CA